MEIDGYKLDPGSEAHTVGYARALRDVPGVGRLHGDEPSDLVALAETIRKNPFRKADIHFYYREGLKDGERTAVAISKPDAPEK